MAQGDRPGFGSKLGVILATAGSAVGLGNVWRFPYMAGEHGGAAFIIAYLLCVAVLGVPCIITEFVIGRHAQANTARAFLTVGGRSPLRWIGYMGVLTGFVIMGYYCVVSGWCLEYVVGSALGRVGGTPEAIAATFSDFTMSPVKPIVWTAVFVGITHYVIVHGVRDGIERASKLMMPTLFVLLLIIVAASCMLPGAGRGVEFLFKPDVSKVTSSVMLGALGQAFYSLSIGMGCVCTYASYFSRQTDLGRSAVQIALIDSAIAILAGLMIFPAAFSVGVSPDSGPSLIFITLPNVFQQAFAAVPIVGWAVSVLFYILLSLAALTSLISLHEVATAFVHEECHTTRRVAAAWVSGLTMCLGVVCSLSLCPDRSLMVGGMSLFDLFDFASGQILLPLGGLLMCLLLGWAVPHKLVRDEFTNCGTLPGRMFHAWLLCIKYVCPIGIALIFLNQFGIV